MKVAIYARVSMDEGAEDRRFQDPENQLTKLREWAAGREWEVYKEYVDKVSGGDSNRPAFIQMRRDARHGYFQKILVWNLDRFSREGILRTLAYIQNLRKYGVGVMSFTESWCDTSADSPVGDLLISFFAWAAAEEKKKISARTIRGIQQRKNLGIWKGGRPKGSRDSYKRKRSKKGIHQDASLEEPLI